MIYYIDIIESDVEGLLTMRGGIFSDRETELYHSIFLAYLTGDNISLFEAVQKAKAESLKDPTLDSITKIGQLRYSIRTKDNLQYSMELLIKEGVKNQKWRGESLSVISTAASHLEMHELARDYSLQSAREFKIIGARKKAVRMLMNSISSESNVRPEKHYLADLYFIYKEAKAVGDTISVGNTLINISHEYQKLGLYNAALKYGNRALAVLSNHNAGGLDFYLALVHRADLHCQMGALFEAKIDIEMAKACVFLEVQGALKILFEKYPALGFSTKAEEKDYYLTPNWRGRNNEVAVKRASKMEGLLIELLVQKPRSKRELCEKIYGDRLSFETTENRLNNLLNRIKKRNPKLIICKESKYHLSEKPIYPIYYTEVFK